MEITFPYSSTKSLTKEDKNLLEKKITSKLSEIHATFKEEKIKGIPKVFDPEKVTLLIGEDTADLVPILKNATLIRFLTLAVPKFKAMKVGSISLQKPSLVDKSVSTWKMSKDSPKKVLKKGEKWATLEHNGVYLGEPYKPANVGLNLGKTTLKVNPDEEEILMLYAKQMEKEGNNVNVVKYSQNLVFIKNYVQGLKENLSKETYTKLVPYFPSKASEISTFNNTFSKMVVYLADQRQNPTEDKKQKKLDELELQRKYKHAIVDGRMEGLDGFKVEPPGLFLGRGLNPKIGCIKPRIRSKDVTLNLGEKAPIPKPSDGGKWKEVVHDHSATWLAKYPDVCGGTVKYLFLGKASKIKGQANVTKYEKARKLSMIYDTISSGYQTYMKSKDVKKKQLGTVVYFIDHFAFRVGNEKGKDEADTVGASTLKVENVEPVKGTHTLTFDFLGKDSIQYKNEKDVDEVAYDNIITFRKGKKGNELLFDKITSADINEYLKTFAPYLSAKVFRTLRASDKYYSLLKDIPKKLSSEEKLLAEKEANRAVATLCNHQRKASAAAETAIEKKKILLKEKKKELKNKDLTDKKKDALKAQIKKIGIEIDEKSKNLTLACTTSKMNYIDPRITVAWAKKNGLDIKKLFPATLQKNFAWAIEGTPAEWDYKKADVVVSLTPTKKPKFTMEDEGTLEEAKKKSTQSLDETKRKRKTTQTKPKSKRSTTQSLDETKPKKKSSKKGASEIEIETKEPKSITVKTKTSFEEKSSKSSPQKAKKPTTSCFPKLPTQLRDYQTEFVNYVKQPDVRGAVAAFEVGTGKTLTAVTSVNCIMADNPGSTAIIITPTSLQENFKDTMLKLGLKKDDPRYVFYTPTTFATIYNYPKAKKQVAKHDEKMEEHADLMKILNTGKAILVVDEAHNFKTNLHPVVSFGKPPEDTRAEFLIDASKKAFKVLLLTGTPMYNGLVDVVNLMAMIRGEKELTEAQFDGLIGFSKHEVQTKADVDKFRKSLNSNTKARDYFKCVFAFKDHDLSDTNFPHVRVHEEVITMDAQLYLNYRTEELRTKQQKKKKDEEGVSQAFYNNLRSASVKFDPPLKARWVASKIKEALKEKRKVIVYSSYLDYGIDKIKSLLGNDYPSYTVTGSVPKAKRQEMVKKYNEGDVNLIFLTKAGGEGLDFKGVRDIIIFERNWNKGIEEQVIGRGKRYRSHTHLPKDEQFVDVWFVDLKKPKREVREKVIAKGVNQGITLSLEKEAQELLTVDEIMKKIGDLKEMIIDAFLDWLHTISIDSKDCIYPEGGLAVSPKRTPKGKSSKSLDETKPKLKKKTTQSSDEIKPKSKRSTKSLDETKPKPEKAKKKATPKPKKKTTKGKANVAGSEEELSIETKITPRKLSFEGFDDVSSGEEEVLEIEISEGKEPVTLAVHKSMERYCAEGKIVLAKALVEKHGIQGFADYDYTKCITESIKKDPTFKTLKWMMENDLADTTKLKKTITDQKALALLKS